MLASSTTVWKLHSLCAHSVNPEYSAHQPGGGGENPTCALHIRECGVADIQEVIERVHYTHSIFGVTTTRCYAVEHEGHVVGGAIYGLPAAYNVAKKYAFSHEVLLELRRFVLEDWCPRNSESRVIAITLRMLKKVGVSVVLAYSDPAAGHTGTIYRATGFEYQGKTSARTHWMWKGKKYPDRNVHQIHFPFHRELRAAIASGDAVRTKIPGKHIFVKRLSPCKPVVLPLGEMGTDKLAA